MPVVAPLAIAAGSAIASKIGSGGSGGGGAQWNPYGMSTATAEQGKTAYDQTQSGLAQQQAFANALGAQNGIGHQNDVYNQLQGVANGTGPNPAQAALAQATGANTANQAALMAGQRGTGANAGLLARQAAMQGGANQQNAAGQGASMQAQQSLNALGQLGSLSGQQVGQQQAALMGYNQAAQGQQSNVLSALSNENNANVAMQSNINNANGNINQQNNAANIKNTSGMVNGIASAAAAALAHGGVVPAFAEGGMALPSMGPRSKVAALLAPVADKGPAAVEKADAEDPSFQAGQAKGNLAGQGLAAGIKAIGSLFAPSPNNDLAGGPMDAMGAPAPMIPGMDPGMPMMASKGGKVPAIVSPGEAYLAPDKVQKVAKGGSVKKEAEKIPGKAKVKGDSLKNDTVPKDLEPGGIVIPRSVMQSKDPALEAHKFVVAILARNNLKK